MNDKFFSDYFQFIQAGLESVDHADLIKASELIKATSKMGNKLIIAGKGGSAAMASHVAVDLTKATGIRAINFNEVDLLTCFANDYGYVQVFEKAV
jgi:D-sedoheptulose 7-phosphate isomerase